MLNQNCASFFCFKLYICQCYNYSLILLACAPLLYKWYTGRLHLTSTAWCSMNILIANTNIWNFAWQALECLIAIELQFKAQKTLHVIAIKGLYPNSHGYVTLKFFFHLVFLQNAIHKDLNFQYSVQISCWDPKPGFCAPWYVTNCQTSLLITNLTRLVHGIIKLITIFFLALG